MMLTHWQGTHPPHQPLGDFVPPRQLHPSDNDPSNSEDDSNQNHNNTTVFQGQTHQKSISTGIGMDQLSNTGMQTSPAAPAPTGIMGATQTSPRMRETGRWYPNYTTSIT